MTFFVSFWVGFILWGIVLWLNATKMSVHEVDDEIDKHFKEYMLWKVSQ